jgi:metal-responsive CopG/Arc/MetJ family transcriptional regulator
MGRSTGGGFGKELKVRIPEDIGQALDNIATSRRTSRSEIVREACIEYVRARLPNYGPHVPAGSYQMNEEPKKVITHTPKAKDKLPGKHSH